MIKILELIDGGFIGGGQTHILSLVKCMNKNNFEAVIAASGKGEFKKLVNQRGFNFREIELPKIYRSGYLKELDKIVKENSIDIIHSHGGVAGMYARFYKKKYGSIKVIHTIHGIHYINSHDFFKKLFSLSVEQYLVPFTDKFICVSDTDYELALANKIIDVEKTVVIKNGIDLKTFTQQPKNKSLLEELNFSEDDFIAGSISRFDYQKNQRFIISNSDLVLKKFPGVKILLAGDGRLLNRCKRLAEDSGYGERIIFTGEVTNPEDYYSLLDVYIFPSMWEGLSISLIEAMASARCIIASDIPSNKELIKNGVNGFTFNLNDAMEYKSKLDDLISDEKLRIKLSGRALLDSEDYSEETMTKKTESEYLKLK
jgi:glycosyltransferase involved in cell wall biosynthesis